MDVTCPAYTYFMEKLKEIKEVLMANLQTPRNLKVEKLDINFPECLLGFFSKRSKYMVSNLNIKWFLILFSNNIQ